MKSVVIIPARYGSTRLPGKVLLKATGKYLIQHTYEPALKAKQPSQVIVATDDRRILKAVNGFGGIAIMTSKRHHSGTDRIAEAIHRLPKYNIIVNLQADEPEINPTTIDKVISLVSQRGIDIGTLACPIKRRQEFLDPSKVKVIIDNDGFAQYFSRAPIPYPREKAMLKQGLRKGKFLRHIGLYVYKRQVLLRLTKLPQSRLEKIEQLEQLRALEHGLRIKVGIVKDAPSGIDTRKDYQEFVRRIKATTKALSGST